MSKTFDVAVIGAGVFGAWTSHALARAGKRVALLDAHGPASSRASSGGESRIIRMGYGPDEIYSRWSLRSLGLWKELFTRTGQHLFHKTGVLWIHGEGDSYASASLKILKTLSVPFSRLTRAELEARYPQMRFAENEFGILE